MDADRPDRHRIVPEPPRTEHIHLPVFVLYQQELKRLVEPKKKLKIQTCSSIKQHLCYRDQNESYGVEELHFARTVAELKLITKQ